MRTLGASMLFSVNAAAQTAPVPALSLEKRADICMVRKRYREAIDVYRAAGNTAALWNRIGIAHRFGRMERAKKSYERAIKPDKYDADAINTAIARYDKALAIPPRNHARGKFRTRYHYENARMYAAGRNDLAIQYPGKALEEAFKEKDKLRSKEFKDLMTLEQRVL